MASRCLLVTLAVLAVFLGVVSGQGLRTGFGGQVRGPLLLAHKTLLNAEAVINQPLTTMVTIYNVGDAPAFDVQLYDKQWLAANDEVLKPLYGSQLPSWTVLLPGHNITHSYAIEPIVGGAVTFEQSMGTVSWSASPSSSSSKSVARTTDVGNFLNVAYSHEAERKFKPHTFEWVIFSGLSLATLALPFLIWQSTRSSFNSFVKSAN